MFAPTVGGGISTMPPAAAERTHTAPTDGATTFDSPFPAIDGRLGVGNLPIARLWSGAGAFDGISGLCLSLFCRRVSRPVASLLDFPAGIFLHTKNCVQMRVKLPPAAYAPGFGLNRRPLGWRSERRRRVPVPFCSRWRIAAPFSAESCPPDDGGDRRAKAREGAHGAASGARTARGREADRRDSGDGRARAPRATDFGQRPKDAGGCAPAPAKISAWGRPPEGGEPDEGKGGAPRGRGGGRGTTRREMNSPALPHATPDAAASSQTSARRQAAGAPMERKTAAGSPSRGRGTERGQRPSRPDGRRRGGQRAREPPHLHPTPQLGRDHASGRRRGGQGGRRRRRPGGTRARLLAAHSLPSAQNTA